MGFTQSFKMAFKQLLSNKMRSLLTMLGIIIGVSSITLLISIAKGMEASLNKQMGDLGSNIISININPTSSNKIYSYEESDELRDIDGVVDICQGRTGEVKLRYDENEKKVSVIATTDVYTKASPMKNESGRFILADDVEYSTKVVVLGKKVAQKMFTLEKPIGKYVKLNGMPYKVVGVLEKKGMNTMDSPDDSVFVPITTGQRLLKTKGVARIDIITESSKEMDSIIKTTEKILKEKLGSKDDFMVFNQQQMIDSINKMQATMTAVLGSIASISLVVGGIGIMNIMLVSVTERTKEIGIRKALGAKRKTILVQFLIESIVVSLIGGIIGATIGIVGANIFYVAVKLDPTISWGVVAFALGFSMLVGIVFGIMPANKASKLKPIQALRAE